MGFYKIGSGYFVRLLLLFCINASYLLESFKKDVFAICYLLP